MPQIHAHADVDLFEEDVPGMPRRSSPAAKGLVGICLVIAGVIGAVGGLRAMHARDQRLADEARSRAEMAAVTAPERRGSIPAPPMEPTEPPTAWANATATPTGVASGTASATADATASEASASTANSAASAGAPGPTQTPTAAPTLPPTRPASASPAAPAQEAPLDTGAEPGKGSLVAQASRALSRGATARAVELSRQAVAANPSNADAWLTLGAAYQASGNPVAARDAYRTCVAQAHTADVSECRVLSGP
jgi:hypothetical protein